MYNHMSVYEHVKFWSEMKGGREDRAALQQLIDACDLTLKRDSRAGKLSGGQKRKLQLACMFVGNSTICLMDEVTTGLVGLLSSPLFILLCPTHAYVHPSRTPSLVVLYGISSCRSAQSDRWFSRPIFSTKAKFSLTTS